MDYIKDNKLVLNPKQPMFEVYANDPGEFPNPADWITEVYYPIFRDLRVDNVLIEGN